MKGIRFTIKRKIIWGFFALIIIFSVNAAYSVYTIYKGNNIIRQSQEVINPITALGSNRLEKPERRFEWLFHRGLGSSAEPA